MYLQSRVTVVWLSWLVAGACGVLVLLVVIYYCRSMPRHQKSFDEQYFTETYTIKENHEYTGQGNHTHQSRPKHKSTETKHCPRPASYAGDRQPARATPPPSTSAHASTSAQYASSGVLDEAGAVGGTEGGEALKTRSLPAFHRPRPRPLSSEADLYQLYAKASGSKQQRSRMRSEHAALIALSKCRLAPPPDDADVVIVYDQRTKL